MLKIPLLKRLAVGLTASKRNLKQRVHLIDYLREMYILIVRLLPRFTLILSLLTFCLELS